jgi:lysyl oxidase
MKPKFMTGAAGALALVAVGAGVALAHPNGDGGGGGNGSGTPATPDEAGRFLPDLVQIMPPRVEIARRGARTLLAFSSAVENYGTGPLIIRSKRLHRPGEGIPRSTMTGWQLVAHSDGSREALDRNLVVRFVAGGGHSHWHLVDFQRFELRTVSGTRLRRDRKTGFCLGDRYDATRSSRMPGEPAAAVYRRRCGLGRPALSSLWQGISVGFGDRYAARLEGQYVNITGLPTGRYVLVQRIDPAGGLVELHKHNNVASMLVKIVRGRRTHARILSWCNFTESCPTPGLRRR